MVRPLVTRGKLSQQTRLPDGCYAVPVHQVCACLDQYRVPRVLKPPTQLSSNALVGLLLIFGGADPLVALVPSHIILLLTRVHDAFHVMVSAIRSNEQFRWLAATTGISSALAAGIIIQVGRRVPHWDVLGIWGGITAKFTLRLLLTLWRVMDRKKGPYWVLGSDADGITKSS